MKANKRGLSDVVTTVLIILVVVAAIAVVGSIVLRSVNQAGDTLEKSQVCLSNKVEITSCQYTVGGNVYVNYRRIGDGTLLQTDSSAPSLTVIRDNGQPLVITNAESIQEGVSGQGSAALGALRSARTVDGTVIFKMTDQSTQTCAVQKVNCELAA